jgi:alkanesulfonate monooxygenase SsuD/methylene tetrahydromethanopterin reductase-like flavin-dependent oxidoreductase (luciferase family)
MEVGYMMFLSNLHDNMPDDVMIREELRIAEMAEGMGYDTIYCPEHHFEDYSMAVDSHQILSWLAARTSTIKLGSACIVLPWWNQPARVLGRITTMDAMTNGRYVIGFARGLARKEFDVFGVPMEQSRDRFDEMASMLVHGLKTGIVEGDGPNFPTPRTEIRPRPSVELGNRLYAVAMSPDSAKQIAIHDCRMMTFVQFSMDKHLPNIEIFRGEYRKNHGKEPGPTLLVDFTYCNEDAGHAEKMMRKHMAANYVSLLKHYEFMADYHKELKGYEAYGESAKFLNELGLEQAVEDYSSQQAWGTPQQILDKLAARKEIIGEFEWNSITSFAGLPYAEVENSMRLIGSKVIPELRTW